MLVFLFTDIEGSSKLWEEHTGAMTPVIARHDQILREQVEAAGGRITKHTGDGITAVFDGGQPLVCALESQVRFAAEPWGEIGELRIRAGLHAGEAEFHLSAGTADGDYFGPPVNATARVMSAAWGGQVLLTPQVTQASPLPPEATLLDLGEHLLKNVSAPQQLYQLEHHQLPWHQFPPPRTLSGQSIRRAVDEGGGQIATLEPQAMGISLLVATLLPALQGELEPESGALEGNLGVLDDLGALSLRGFVAGFAERLRGGKPLPAPELQALLRRDLQTQWQAGDEAALALRTDASRLLQAVHGVEAAMAAASDEVKEALARGLADLGTQFGEFRWMLAGVRDTLAEMRARQALQLALQREQLDLQRQQLVKTNLILHRQQVGPQRAELTVSGEVEDEPPAAVACPYKGLAAFESQDAEFFYGREELVAELTARLAGTRFLAVVGPSGSGKSSLVRAGLLPAVWAGALPASQQWQTLVITPGAHPLNELAARLSVFCGDRPASILRDLEADPRTLELAIRRALADQPDEVKLLLVVDQFEEIFALCRNATERRAFIDALLYAVEAKEGRAVVVPTVRADFYGRCADYPALAARMGDGLLVGPMGEPELRQAIERPAQVVGLRLEPGLADTVIDDVAGEPGALPLLSHALLETFARRRGRTMTLTGYAASGGVAGAIAQTADTVYGRLDAREQALARSIFLRLTELGEEGAQDTRRRVSPSELIRSEGEALEVEALLQTLADARLITTGEDSVEVAHEALIREWPLLRGWLEEDREGLRVHRHLTEAAGEWERLGREEGELYRGARLAAAGEWQASHSEALNPLERQFLAASQELAEREEAEREAQRQRELEAAQALAAEQEKRADAERRRAQEAAQAAGRLRRRALLLAGAMVVAVVLAVFAFFAFRQADLSTSLATSRELANAAVAGLDEDPERSALLALEALEAADTLEARNALRRALPEMRLLHTLPLPGNASGVAFSPDGALLAGALDRGVLIWDATSGEELLLLQQRLTGQPRVAFSPDGTRLFASSESDFYVWEMTATATGAITTTNPITVSGYLTNTSGWYTIGVNFVSFSPDGQHMAVAHWKGAPTVFDLETMTETLRLEGHAVNCRDVSYSPDGSLLATAGDDFTVRIWDAETGQELLNMSAPNDRIYSVDWSPDGRRLVSADESGVMIVWDPLTGEKLLTKSSSLGSFFGVSFADDGRSLVTPMTDGTVREWDAETGDLLKTYAGHTGGVQDAAVSPDGTLLASAGTDRTVRLWIRGPMGELYAFSLDIGASLTARLTYSPDGWQLATGTGAGPAEVWDPGTGERVLALPEVDEGEGSVAVAYSPDGKLLAVGTFGGPVHIWDLASGEYVQTLTGHKGMVLDLAFSPDGTRLGSVAWDGLAAVWDLASGQAIILTPNPEAKTLFSITFSPDGSQVATASPMEAAIYGGVVGIHVWDAVSGTALYTIPIDTLSVYSVRYSPDGELIAAGVQEGDVLVYDTSSQELVRTLTGHSGLVAGLAFTPDGKYLTSCSRDNSVKVWDADTGKELATLAPPTRVLTFHAISPDGTRLATSSEDGTIRTFVLSTDELVALARSRVTRSLTTAECQKYLHVEACPVEP